MRDEEADEQQTCAMGGEKGGKENVPEETAADRSFTKEPLHNKDKQERQELERQIEGLKKKLKNEADEHRRELDQSRRELQEVKNRWARATHKAEIDGKALLTQVEKELRARLDKETKQRLRAQKEASMLAGRLEMQKNMNEDLIRQLTKVKEDLKHATAAAERGRFPRCGACRVDPVTDIDSALGSRTPGKEKEAWRAAEAEEEEVLKQEGSPEKVAADGSEPEQVIEEEDGEEEEREEEEMSRSCDALVTELQFLAERLRELAQAKRDEPEDELCDVSDRISELSAGLSGTIFQALVSTRLAAKQSLRKQQEVSTRGMTQLNEMLKESHACYWRQRDHLMEVIVDLEETVRQQKEALKCARQPLTSTHESKAAGGNQDGDKQAAGVAKAEVELPPELLISEVDDDDDDNGGSEESGERGNSAPATSETSTITPPSNETPRAFKTRIKPPTPVSIHRREGDLEKTPRSLYTPGGGREGEAVEWEAEEGFPVSDVRGLRKSTTPRSASKLDESTYSSRHFKLGASHSASKIGRTSLM